MPVSNEIFHVIPFLLTPFHTAGLFYMKIKVI